jgi:hypothetical protein
MRMVQRSPSISKDRTPSIDPFAKTATPTQIRDYISAHAKEPASRTRVREAIRRWGLFEKDGQLFIGRRWK